jgi:F-type H+-transporting ATPase subunit O
MLNSSVTFRMLQRQLFRTASRGFAKAAAAPAAKKLKIYSPAGTYAHSLLDACVEEKADAKKVSAALSNWTQLIDDNTSLKRFLDDTEYTWEDKQSKLEEHVYKEAGLAGETPELEIAREMISVTMEENVTALLGEIAVDFETLVLDHVKEVKCVVTSANALTPAQVDKVAAKLKTLGATGETLTVTYEVDEELVGGLTLQIGDKFQDLSVRSAILKGETALRGL